jgi:GNAT superfamily N-acetyltransferase
MDVFDRQATFADYAAERRRSRIPNYTLEPAADLTRYHPKGGDDEALLAFARFSAATADRRIDEELARLHARGWAAEWKVHDFDEPSDLKSRLEARGLSSHQTEALMVLPLDATHPRAPAPGYARIEEAQGAALDELAAFQEAVWDCRLPWLAGVLHEMSDPATGTGIAYCARIEGRVVGSGWIDFHGGSPFAQLCGGAVAADCRGRGIYSQLFEARLEEARRRGVRHVAVDAAPMSRPILERKGFRFVCHTYPMRTRPFGVKTAP